MSLLSMQTLAWRFAVVSMLCLAVAMSWGVRIGEWLAPAYKAELQWLDDSYHVKELLVTNEGADKVFRVVVVQARYIVLNGRAFYPDARGQAHASTLMGNTTLAATLLLSVALSWPCGNWWAYALRLPFAGMALVTMWAIDVPMVLWSSIWSLHVDAFAPDIFSPLLIWSQFLQGGGRLAVAALLGFAAALFSQCTVRTVRGR